MPNRVVRWAWFGLGWVCVAVGTIGIVVPGLPTTVFFVGAAACFSRSSPRFEQWVLTRPGIGPMVRDYRAGLGMPKRAKVMAVTMIAVVCSLSAFVAIDRWVVRGIVLAVGAIGIAWILWRIPTRPEPAVATAPTVVDPAIARAFTIVAIAEATSWAGLLVGMFVKYVLDGGEGAVAVFGRIHGVVVLVYVAVAVVTAWQLKWRSRTLAYALLASVPPLCTLWFERWARRTGRLVPRYRAPGD